MELKRRINPKYIFIGIYFLAFVVFLIYGLKPAEAAQSLEISNQLKIPSIELVSDVTDLELENQKLSTPDKIVGSFSYHDNKTLLIGHSTTVFQDLNNVEIGDEIIYGDSSYRVSGIQTEQKENIKMQDILKAEREDTIVIMTCAGELLENGDATHRLIVTATKE